MSDYSIFNHLWTLEMAYVDCTPKQYRDWVLEHGLPICVAGRARDLTYKKIAPGVIRVSKVPLEQDKPDPRDAKIAALKAENEAAVKNMAALQSELAAFKNWQPSDPEMKEAMVCAEADAHPEGIAECSHWYDGCFCYVNASVVLARALRAAMVRLEDAEKKIAAMENRFKGLI